MNNIFAVVENELNASLESTQTTKEAENEIVMYARVGNPEGLAKGSMELHEELLGKFEAGPRARVRKVTRDDKVEHTLTVKVKIPNDDGINSNTEYSVVVDESFFEGFQAAASQRLTKKRYKFSSESIKLTVGIGEDREVISIPDVVYEVDLFIRKDGSVCEWCKIDVEVDVILNFLAANHPDIQNIKLNIKINHLPFEPTDVILDVDASEETREFIDGLWNTEFTTPVQEDN